ncbi:MAG: universal stress protein UspA [Cellvibrionaceae bacterium]|nr:universal stress protein UspA [Cellvibrionaceae bacterium]
MSNYTHILAGVDLSDESQQVLERAANLAVANQAKLSVVHIVEPLTFAYGGDIPVDLSEIQEQLHKQAREQLTTLIEPYQVSADNLHVLVGQPTTEIHDLADNLDIDLIVVGSHGRKGLALLLGSTANGILHGAKTDVLAVRVKD